MAKQIFAPTADNILILRDESARETRGGILLPDVAKRKSTTGKVLAIGPGKRSEKDGSLIPLIGICVGDVVAFGSYAGSLLELDDGDGNLVEHIVMRPGDILGRVS